MSSTHSKAQSPPPASHAARIDAPSGDITELTYEPLNASNIIDSVKDDGAGAIAVFIGTTRDSFQGIVGEIESLYIQPC